jgi:hypothetical protein
MNLGTQAVIETAIEIAFNDRGDGELSEADLATLRELDRMYKLARKVAIKKLSKNDRSWAFPVKESNQDGFYVPVEWRGGFFPSDEEMPRREDKPHIYMAPLKFRWPLVNDAVLQHNYRRFTNKASEGHLTVPPKKAFETLGPASFLVVAEILENGEKVFNALTIDSASPVYEIIETKFDLGHAFLAGVFDSPNEVMLSDRIMSELELLIVEFVQAANDNTLGQIVAKYKKIPASNLITAKAQTEWLGKNPGKSFDPFKAKAPGNVLRELTTDIEFSIYRTYELRYRAAQTLELLFRDGLNPTNEQIIHRVVKNFIPLYEVMRDASQQRRTRVGSGFEAHIKAMLDAGNIPYVEQMVVSTRRPDFVLPVRELYEKGSVDALVIAAKTTLRERWKQVGMETRNCRVYLATLDEKITLSAVNEMRGLNIHLLIPEAFKADRAVAEYVKAENVHTFKDFFNKDLLSERKPKWSALGYWA